MSRRGFTLTEVLVGMAVFALLGMTLTRILINDSRFVSRQDALMSARQGARAAMNTVVQELQMISDGGLIWDSAKAIQARIPIAFGVACRTASNITVAALLPTDSVAYASALASGAPIATAYLGTGGTYQFPTSIPLSVASSTNSAACTADSIRVLDGQPPGKLVALTSAPALPMPSGSLIYIYQVVTYRFANSTDPTLAGRKALFRQVATLTPDELVAPFDTAAGFRCLVGTGLTPTACPVTSGVADVRGLELRLISASEKPPQGATRPQTFNLTTRIIFTNCPTPAPGNRCW